jgi:asparagine synthase (glutamine-hydrolysing)
MDAATLLRMREALHHRGPDGEGVFIEGPVGLVHRRLSIVDLAHGAQPMASADGRLQIVYNGEVFNHPSLRRELSSAGVEYRTNCDTETVLHVYAAHGIGAPRHLRGMFAFALWDRATRSLLLARDRFGVKPLYYVHAADGSLYFASEIKALLAARVVEARLNVDALPDHLANHAPSGDTTLFAGIHRLPAGHTLLWRDGAVQIERYWDLSLAEKETDRSDESLISEYGDRLREAVRIRLMSDVPLGVFLSGGIDSAAITALMSEMVEEPVKTFSVAFAEREANELEYARIVAARFRTEHREVTVQPDEFFNALPTLIWHEDEPIAHPSSVALYFVARLAAAHVKVVLTGEGSDETLAGYGRYRSTVFNMAAARLYERSVPRQVRALASRAIESLPSTMRVRQRLDRTFLRNASDLDALYFDNFAVFSRSQQRTLLAPALRERLDGVDPYAAFHRHLARTDATTLLDRLLYVDAKTYLHELLMKQDQMSMAASIESRVPFLDHPLVEFSAHLPNRLKLRGMTTKYVLRQAMRSTLPKSILSRPKMGFPVPVSRWFRESHRHLVDELLLGGRARDRGLFEPGAVRSLVERDRRGDGKHWERIWALANIELWHRIQIDGESPVDMMPALLNGKARRAPAPRLASLPARPAATITQSD